MQSILSFVRLLYVGKDETIQLSDREKSDPLDIIVYEYPGFGHRFGQKIKKQKEFLQEAVSFFRSIMIQRIMLLPEALYWEYQYKSISVVGTSLGTCETQERQIHTSWLFVDLFFFVQVLEWPPMFLLI